MTIPRDIAFVGTRVPTKSYSRIAHVLDLPNLIHIQLESFRWFQTEGLRELFDEISPIQDFTGTRMELRFGDYEFGEPKYSEAECRQRDVTFSAPLKVNVQLLVKETGEVKEQGLFMGDFPLMTPQGTFVINGAERVVVSQLVRSPGVYFTLVSDPTSGRDLCFAKLIPNRGAWLEFESSNKNVLSVKVDRKRKIPITPLLRAIDSDDKITDDSELGTNERLQALFEDVDTHPDHRYIQSTLEREPGENKRDALLEFYRRLRPGDPPTVENARGLMTSLFFNPRRYDLGRVGRYKLNKRLDVEIPGTTRTLVADDLRAIVREMIRMNNSEGQSDDIDHLGNRRVRAVGELIQNQFRIGLLRMERVVRERMTITDPDQATPSALINIRPVVAAMKEFFGGSQLSQFMDQTNPLAELTHKRRLSALGPGGLSRDRAGFDVRDVHHSHYGRICPIETPEGPNIGLIGSLATYSRINQYGFIETPYRRVVRELRNNSRELVGRVLREDVTNERGRKIGEAGTEVSAKLAEKLAALPRRMIPVKAYVSNEIVHLSADQEDKYVIAQANVVLDEANHFVEEKVEVRFGERFLLEAPTRVELMDVSPKQIVSVATALIPFLEHDDANRALMGSNMQRQAVPLLRPEVALIATGMERQAAYDSGQVVFAEEDGVVTNVTASEITVRYQKSGERTYPLAKFVRSNQGTCINQRPIVDKGQRVTKEQPLADSSSTAQGELALGQSVLCAFMSWEGYNFEDAIVISEAIAKEDRFTSIHMEKHETEARDTKLGPEEITRDIPNVGEESLRDLDEEGIIRVGAEVGQGDILVGKITPKGETELTAEEKLLRAIFGEKAREVKDTSLRVPHGERGKVIEVTVFSREDHDELPAGVNKLVRVSVAQKRKVAEGDKMAGRHGNKGVIARILPVEDLPYLADGRPVDIILNPIGVPSRMNVGQVLETHLGWAAQTLGFRGVSPVFDGANDKIIEDVLGRTWLAVQAGAIRPLGENGSDGAHGSRLDVEAFESWLTGKGYTARDVLDDSQTGVAKRVCLELWLEEMGEKRVRGRPIDALQEKAETVYQKKGVAPPIFGKQTLYDGRTGLAFDQPVTVGYIYMMKLVHLVEDKIHARSTGPYSLITQQPLGGKAQCGGQRFGEMEVWALEAYGAAHILQELLTVKSDDVVGRVKTYESIVKGDNVLEPGVPESFKVLVKELQSLGLAVEVLNEDEERVTFVEETAEVPELGINLAGFEGEDLFGARS
ncbi:MAG: DNA-directed RNA polymerase subunit beta [Chloroflexi bacterium RBG_16_63_12]|nr:MAG: DNA-directed RNA polymerase subunit beta [Chloroflexi bacterium RBG_16_63_12]